MSSIADALLVAELLKSGKTDKKTDSPDTLRAYMKMEKFLKRLKEGDKHKEKEKEKKKEWSVEERICFGILLTMLGPFIGASYCWAFEQMIHTFVK